MPKRLVSQLALVVGLTLIYFAAGTLGLRLAFVNASATAVWPPTGIALAAFVMLGYRIWPAILLGAFLVNVTTSGAIATSIAIAVGNTLEGVIGGYLVNRFSHGRHVFERARDLFSYVLLACIVSTTVSATVGVTSLTLSDLAAWADYGSIWLTWWLGDAVGALMVAPVLVLWAMNPHVRWNRRYGLEAILLCLSALLVALIVFGGLFRLGIQDYPLEFLLLPLIVWAAFRFGQRGAATLALGLSGIAIWGTLAGFGPFARGPAHEALLLLQAFMGTIALTGLGMAAVAAERQQAREAAERAAERTLQLQQVTAALSEARTPDQVAQVILQEGRLAIGAEAGAVFGLTNDGQTFELLHSMGYAPEATVWPQRSSSTEPGLLREALITRGLVTLESPADFVARWPDYPTIQAAPEEGTTVAMPLLVDIRVLGVFALAFRTERRFTAEDRLFLTTLGQQCAQALDRSRLYAQEQAARSTAEAAVRLRDVFLATAAHELRTPLTSILGYADLLERRLRKGNGLEREQRAVHIIVRQAGRLSKLITTLLELGRIERDELELERAPLDLCALARRVVAASEPLLTQHTIAYIAPKGAIMVNGDAMRLEQALENLVQNAIKYSPGGGKVQVCIEQHNDTACLWVRDEGIGIPHTAIPQLFNRFYRASNVDPQRITGMGIGLYVVKEIVTLHGGTVGVESSEGEGSTFIMILPLSVEHNAL
jgi:signal transduction histidine kinase/integral membrane sensor domain MASE1